MSTVFPAVKKTLLQMLGPSIIFVALSLNGGEMLLWPHLVANYGFAILWPIPLILILQFVVNLEIERYTLVTGKSVEASLAGKTFWLSIVFAVSVLVALVWPAWITTAGNLVAVILGFSKEHIRNAGLIISILMLLGTLGIFFQKKTYKILEYITRAGLIIALSIILLVVVVKFDAAAFWLGLKGLVNFGYVPSDISKFTFVAALAYGGVAGVLNLVQSEWIKDKGYGVNAKGTDASLINLNQKESVSNFKKWFSFINKEHFLLFVIANVFSIFLLAYLGYLLVPIGSAQGFDVLTNEIKALNSYFPYFGTLFALSGILIFSMANITILDSIGRLIHRLLSPFKKAPSSSSISVVAVLLGVGILLASLVVPNFKQPFFLLVTSAVLSAFTMWLYPPMLIKLNYSLPKAYRPKWWRIILVLLAAAFYGFITLWAASDYLPMWLIVLVGLAVSGYHVKVIYETLKNA